MIFNTHLFFHGNDGCTNAPRFYVTRTLSIVFISIIVLKPAASYSWQCYAIPVHLFILTSSSIQEVAKFPFGWRERSKRRIRGLAWKHFNYQLNSLITLLTTLQMSQSSLWLPSLSGLYCIFFLPSAGRTITGVMGLKLRQVSPFNSITDWLANCTKLFFHDKQQAVFAILQFGISGRSAKSLALSVHGGCSGKHSRQQHRGVVSHLVAKVRPVEGVCNQCLELKRQTVYVQGGSNMTGTNCDLFTHSQSRSYLNHLV